MKFYQRKRSSLKETEAIIRLSGGDARKLLNIFELVYVIQKKMKKLQSPMNW